MISYKSIKLYERKRHNFYGAEPNLRQYTFTLHNRELTAEATEMYSFFDLLLAITNFRSVLQFAWFFRIILSLPQMAFNAVKPTLLLLSHPFSLTSRCVSIGNEMVNKKSMFINVSALCQDFPRGQVTPQGMKIWFNLQVVSSPFFSCILTGPGIHLLWWLSMKIFFFWSSVRIFCSKHN